MKEIKVSPRGRVVFISGANRGIGRAITIELLEKGAKKVYAGVRDLKSMDDLKPEYGNRLVPVFLDLRDDKSIIKTTRLTKDVEILINNAGVYEAGGFCSDETLDSMAVNFEVNVWGLVKLTVSLIDRLKQRECAAIVNISSVLGLASMPIAGAYSASKAAVHSITQGLRGELLMNNILVMGVYPGPIETEMTKDLDMEKDSPINVAKEIVNGLIEGKEYVFPDVMSKQVGELYLTEPVTVEKQFAHFISEEEKV
ncbi:SDR family NAD(P)-dependent oxidoreductase [Labilibaculum sp. DW002]|uniref:SDR family NAD(P)-dependent oxidoreductase n=1 Tax=Paralabilibaculum antarcticum TaxID=2912572 RepID=A0ABT5VNJ8_9BACT|nr:SDR family NAD(P)-dependent oxidoreductase [Labilibaculum sp. DW002]MDE5416836.1 SDR family NAD(P)-dependent oxidoreductase [Labilibaculum sp. DW002]